jgi:hypothetical protein|eukprot:CAMPEP_0174359594 /NCGR_PEP_ID=MMETSP0811_2-20130205/49555_1 /TAXON_ID=73025 ORGANISM="Eutreptiella gymnastica-like, Strain CCMP1594" /NCGR_SAMPLE_ID=MMETSP0811_2 /ASSEMBLY_ACC=CAM_ASM_000667 /LENGTH=64 /DNA_ID=CAMNT_0015494473 /DNA_START=492 /DNA_END=686 /DNA_ORIENTATION=-
MSDAGPNELKGRNAVDEYFVQSRGLFGAAKKMACCINIVLEGLSTPECARHMLLHAQNMDSPEQ